MLAIKPLERITLGSMCSFPNAMRLMEQKLAGEDEACRLLSAGIRSADGRRRFPLNVRLECYRYLLGRIHERVPGLPVALCLEEREAFSRTSLESGIGRCNCVL